MSGGMAGEFLFINFRVSPCQEPVDRGTLLRAMSGFHLTVRMPTRLALSGFARSWVCDGYTRIVDSFSNLQAVGDPAFYLLPAPFL